MLGRSQEVVDLILRNPKNLPNLVECLFDEDPGVCMRASDAIEKISSRQAGFLQPYKAPLLGLLEEATQQEVRWHLALIVPRLRLTTGECGHVAEVLQKYLADRSSIVKTLAMQGLSDLTRQDPSLLRTVLDLVRSATRAGTPAMRARGRMLLKLLEPRSG